MSTQMIGAGEVAKALHTSKGYAYKVNRKLNEEKEERGMLVVKGKISDPTTLPGDTSARAVATMTVSKDPVRGTYCVQCWYKDWTGKRCKKTERGLKTKKAANAWEVDFLRQVEGTPDMTLNAFYDLYCKDMDKKLRNTTKINKANMIESKILHIGLTRAAQAASSSCSTPQAAKSLRCRRTTMHPTSLLSSRTHPRAHARPSMRSTTLPRTSTQPQTLTRALIWRSTASRISNPPSGFSRSR